MANSIMARESWRLLDRSTLTLQLRLDVLDVALGLRPAARVLVRSGGEDAITATLLLALGLSVIVGRGSARCTRSSSVYLDGFSSDQDCETERFAIFYVGATEARAEVARAADESRNDQRFGSALGYPRCCVEFVHCRGGVPKIAECIATYSKDGSFNPLVWPAAAILDGALLPHFPCSQTCVHSIRLATTRWGAVRSFMPIAQTAVRRAAVAAYWIDSCGGLRAGTYEQIDCMHHAIVQPCARLPETDLS